MLELKKIHQFYVEKLRQNNAKSYMKETNLLGKLETFCQIRDSDIKEGIAKTWQYLPSQMETSRHHTLVNISAGEISRNSS